MPRRLLRTTLLGLLLMGVPVGAHGHVGSVGPFTLTSDDGDWQLRPGLAAQLQYRLDATDVDLSEDRATDNRVLARRIRPTLRGTLVTQELGYYLHLSTAPGALELMDFYIDYAMRPFLRARVGMWKIPFTRFRIGSFQNLTLVDWPVATTYFGAERQMGVAVHNGYEKTPRGLQYEAGVFTGANTRAAHAVGLSLLHGEQVKSASDLADPAPPASIHPELVAHVAYNLGGIDACTDTDWTGGPLRLSAGLSAAWDLDPDRVADLSLRLAPEVLVKLRQLSLNLVLYLGFARRGESVTEQRVAMLGAVAQLSYLFAQRFELAARYTVIQIDATVADSARERADSLIYAETDIDRREALMVQYRDAGKARRDQEATLGVNLYLIGRSLKLQTDFSWLAHDEAGGGRSHDLRLRSQLQLAF
jgi:hypothetical protein